MEDRRRVAVVQAAGQGSGYVLAPRLVLTAHHVLGTDRHATVRTPGGTPTRCRVVWARSDGPYDAALLLADEDVVRDAAPVRWGRLVAPDPVDVSVLGFTALAGREGRIGSQPFRGTVDPLESVETDRYVLALEGSPPLGPGRASPWAGLSGGAVWCGETLVGVAVADLPEWPHSRLEAVPGYVLLADGDFRELIRRHTGTAVHLEPAELTDAIEALTPLKPRSVATLLHPRAETVRFTGRRELLDDMVAWSTRGDDLSVAILSGPGGAGKTRMAREVGHRLAASRHAVVHLRRRSGPEQHRLLARTTAPVFLVIDYAESRAAEVGALLDRLSGRPRGVPFNVLLVARAVGQWWDDVRSDSGPETAEATGRARRWTIGDTASLGADQDEVFRTAVEDLRRGAAALGLAPVPDGAVPVHRSFTRKPPRTVLDIHMEALASVLTPHLTSEVRTAQETLLLHESAYWRRTSRQAPLDGLGDAALRNAVVAATLVGPVAGGRAHTILGRVPRIGDHPESVRRAVADWMRDLYPRPDAFDGGTTWQWGPLEPDPLGEYLVGARVAAEPEIFLRLLDVLGDEETVHALLVLSRAGAQLEGAQDEGAQLEGPRDEGDQFESAQPDAAALDEVLRTAVRAHPARLAPLLIAAGTRSAEPALLIAALDLILVEELLPQDELQELAHRTPLMTRALASWSVRLAELLARVADEQPSDNAEVRRAVSLHSLATRLLSTFRFGEALAASESALGLLDEVSVADPALRGALLHQCATALGKSGRAEEAVREGRKAVALLTDWQPKDDPDGRLLMLAAALNGLSHHFAHTGDFDAALDAALTSVAMRRDLVTRWSEALPDLARSLNTLAARHEEGGRLAEALEAAEESVRIRRDAAQERPDAYLDELVSSLRNKADILKGLGDLAGAWDAMAEAASLWRHPTRSDPPARQFDYVTLLHDLAGLHAEAGASADAVEAAGEAVGLARKLVVAHGRGYLPLLGASFLMQTNALMAAGCHPAAFRASNRAAQVFRTVFHEGAPDVSGLLSALRNQGQYLSLLERDEEAEHAAAEAVAALMGLPEEQRAAHAEEHADAHATHAARLLALGRTRESREARDAALGLYRRLERAAPGTYTHQIAALEG